MDDYPVDSILVGVKEFVYTTHVTHQHLFYVHVESRSSILDEIMSKLEARYTHLRPEEKPLLNKRLGSLCAAKFTDDGVWYRAKITGLLKNGHIEVQFVDYGNTDYVTEERIKAIDPDLVKYPVQSYRCCLADVYCPQEFWTPELIIQFEDRVIDRRCQAVFVGEKKNDEIYLLQMFDSEGNNINQLFGAVSRPDKKQLQNEISPGSGFRETSFDIGAVFQAAIVYVKSPGLFWCQNTQFASDILILSEELSRLNMIQEMRPLTDVRPGTVCAAKFSEDEAWYRGVVDSVSGNRARVYFVDYGNTEVVSLDVVCNLSPEMRSMPALGIKCRLHNVDSKGREWRPEIIEAFEELVVDKEFEVKVVGREGDAYVVTLFDVVDNKDVGAQLQCVMRSANLAPTNKDINSNKQIPPAAASSGIGPSLHVGSKADVYLSWVENPGDFWVQLSSAEELLEQMSQELQEVYSQQQPLAQPTPGAFVVAKFSEDGMWYRSLVLKVYDDGRVRVLFIDYGNSNTVPVTDLRQVTAAFGQVIPLASRCCLAGVRPLSRGDKSWGPDAKNILENLTDNGCQCEILSETNSHKIVSLTVGSRDIARELVNMKVVAESTAEPVNVNPLFWPELTVKQSETKQVVVTHLDSPNNFWCHITTNIPSLRDLMKRLNEQYASGHHRLLGKPIPGQACVVFCSQEKSWYRAKITSVSSSTCTVHFVDYGHSDVVSKSNIFVAEPGLMSLTAQALHCGLSVSSDSSLLTDTFKKAVFKRELQLHVLEVSGGKAIVELFDGRTKISELLAGTPSVSREAAADVDFVPAKKVAVGSTVKAFASFVVSPNKFSIQMSGVDVELEDLMDNIALVYNSNVPPPAVAHPHSGQPCVALYAEDGNWYRGQIVAVKGSACLVLFVDFGNEDTVSNENIRVLTPELAQVPVLSYRCSIHGVPETEWSEDALEYFETLIMEKELSCTFVAPSSVRVLIGTQDVVSLLLKAGHGATAELSSPGQSLLGKDRESDSGVSTNSKHRVSDHGPKAGRGGEPRDGDVWDNDEGASAEHKQTDSHAFGKRGDVGARSGGQLKYTDYRREELGSGDGRDIRAGGSRNGRDSRFEDDERKDFRSGFGRDGGGRDSRFENGRKDFRSDESRDNRRNGETGGFRDAGDRRGRNSRFEGAPRRDFGSSDGRESDSSSGSRNERNFRSAGAHGREPDSGDDRGQRGFRSGGSRESTSGRCHNDRRTTDQTLPSNSEFIYPEIPSEPENAILVHMDEDGTFYLQMPSMEKDILFLSKRLAGSYKGGSGPRLRETPEVGTICCAKFADDGSMYRAKVEDIQGGKAVLRYVDYGNTGECAFGDLKFLFPDLLQHPALAFPCKLRGYNWSLEEAEKFAKATLDKELKVTFISSTSPFEVDIMTPEGDLLKVLTGESAPPAPKLSPKPSGMSARSADFIKKSPSGGFGSRFPNSEGDIGKVSSSSPRKGDSIAAGGLPPTALPKQVYCPKPPPQDTVPAVISHVGSDGYFYLQLVKDMPTLDSISEQLQALPDGITHPDVSPGASCAAVFSEDSMWYRARITETNGDTLSVLFVDYGNEDSVTAASVKPLSHELLAYPPLAYKCQFPELGALSSEAQVKLAEYLTEHQVTVSFSGQSSPFNACIKTEQGEDLQDVVCPLEKYRPPVVPTEVTPVGVTHIEGDGRFFIQLYQNYSSVTALQSDLNSVAEIESGIMESAQVDMPCCVKVDTDMWQRGKIIDVTGDSVQVLLVDSGKSVAADVGSLRSLPVQFLKTAPFALECRLKGVENWAGGLLEKFSEMTQDKILNATFYNRTFPLRVSLARSIELDLLGLAAPPPDSPEKSPVRKPSPALQTAPQVAAESAQGETAYISHVDAHGGFYVQTVTREEELNDLADSLEALVADTEHLHEVAAGDVVCAQFTEDDAWYRARIESCTDDGQFLIRFIDYGNSDVVGLDRLKALPEEVDISTVPPFAVKCRFVGVADDLTPEQVDKFREMVADQTVKVVFRSVEDDVQEVDVSLDGLHLVQSLELETQTTLPDLTRRPKGEDENEFVEDVEKCEEPVLEKVADCETMEAVDSSKCPGASSINVVDSASGTFEPASSDGCAEFVSVEHGSPSSAADVGDSKPSDTYKLSVVGDSSTVAVAASAGETARVSVSVDDRMEVTVSHVDSPHKFYMQLVTDQRGLDNLMNAIFEHFSNSSQTPESVEAVRVGDVCAALFEDESWYRVRIDSLPGDGTCEIFYMDYGNTETVDVTSVRHLPERFQSMSPWALKARLGGVDSVEGHWTEEAVEEFKKLVEDRHLLADVLQVSQDSQECTVHLLYLGILVHEELIKKGHAVAVDDGLTSKNLQHFYSDGDSYGAGAHTDESAGCLESTRMEGDDNTAEDKVVSNRVPARRTLGCVSSSLQELAEVSVFVSHSSSTSCHFWCQLSSSADSSDISSTLASIYGTPSEENLPTDPLCVGDLVVAMFDDDGELYRAQVLSLTESEGDKPQKVRVRFVDYGNEAEVSQELVFRFEDALYAWPAQAFCCCLDKVQPVDDTWSPKASQTLSEIVINQQLLLKLVGREQDGVMLVDAVLQESGKSVAALMVEAGLAKVPAADSELKTSSKSLEMSTAGEISEIESLEMSQPILESTTVVGNNLPKRVPTVTFEEAGDQQFGSVKLSLHTEYDVIVSNDELPSSFHVQLLELRDQYLSLMSEIASHVVSYTPGNSEDTFSPELSEACLVQHCGLWYRGLVTAKESDSWNVKSVDCGWVVSVSSDKLMALPAHLRELPAQAVPCYLAGIVSVELEWATDGVTFFMDSVREATLCMYVLECADDGKYGVYLSDLDNTSSQSVNRALVELGYAEVVPGSNIEVQIEMERTLDTDMLQDLEQSFNEVSQLKCNTGCGWDEEGMSSIAFDSENPLKDTYEDSDVCGTAKLEMDKTLYHLVQIPKSLMTTNGPDSEENNCLPSDSDSLPASGNRCQADISEMVQFDCASAVERIDKMGCVDNYPDEGLFAEFESLGDTVNADRNVTGDKEGEDSVCQSLPDVTSHGGADEPAEDVPKSVVVPETHVQGDAEVVSVTHVEGDTEVVPVTPVEGDAEVVPVTPVQGDAEVVLVTHVQGDVDVQTSGIVKSEATATSNSIEHSDPEIHAQTQEALQSAQPVTASSDAGNDQGSEQVSQIAQPVTTTSDAGDDQGCIAKPCEGDSLQGVGHQEDTIIPSFVLIAGPQGTGVAVAVSGVDLCGESGCVSSGVRARASRQLDQGEVVPEGGFALNHESGPGVVILAEDAAAILVEAERRSPSLSVASVSDEYESCCEEVTSQCLENDGDDESSDSSFTETSFESSVQCEKHEETNYDTSTLLFSDSYVDSSMDVSSMFETSSTEASSLCSDGLDSFCAGASNISDSSHSQSSSSSASTVVTSSGSPSDDSSWIHDISSSSSGSSTKTATDMSAFESEPNSSETAGLFCEKRQDRKSLILSRSGELTGSAQVPEKLGLEIADVPDTAEGAEHGHAVLCGGEASEMVIDTSGAVPGPETYSTEIFEQAVTHTDTIDIPETAPRAQTATAHISEYVPGFVLDTSGTAVDMPGTVLDMSGTIPITPGTVAEMQQTFLDTPDTNLGSPVAALFMSGTILDTPETIVNGLGTIVDTSGTVSDSPRSIIDTLMAILDSPRTVLDTSLTMTDYGETEACFIPEIVEDIQKIVYGADADSRCLTKLAMGDNCPTSFPCGSEVAHSVTAGAPNTFPGLEIDNADLCKATPKTARGLARKLCEIQMGKLGLSGQGSTECSGGREKDIVNISKAVVDTPSVEDTDDNNCGNKLSTEGHDKTSEANDIKIDGTSVGARPVLVSADDPLRGPGRQMTQSSIPWENIPSESQESSPCRFPTFITVAGGEVPGIECLQTVSRAEDQERVSLKDDIIRENCSLESCSGWVATEVSSGNCGEVRVMSADTCSVGDVGCRPEVLDTADCGCEETTSEVCSVCPDMACGGTASVCVWEVIESICPDTRICDRVHGAADGGCEVIESICPEARASDGEPKTALCSGELLGNAVNGVWADSNIAFSNGPQNVGVYGPELERNVCGSAYTINQQGDSNTSNRSCYSAPLGLCEHGLLPFMIDSV